MKTIPIFPHFKTVDMAVQEDLQTFCARFPAYSDFNFVSLFSWNTDESMAVSQLNENIVFRMSDYVSGEVFYSLLGDNRLPATARQLFEDAKRQGYLAELRLVPETCALELAKIPGCTVTEDPDNHDYLLSTEALATLLGNRQRHTRKLVYRFEREQGAYAKYGEIDLSHPSLGNRLLEIFHHREDSKADSHGESELHAFTRHITNHTNLPIRIFGIWVKGELQAFITCELLGAETVLGHFWKANLEHPGIYHYLLHQLSKELHALGYSTINFEQDLGVEGLRTAKQRLRPVGFLKKYVVSMA